VRGTRRRGSVVSSPSSGSDEPAAAVGRCLRRRRASTAATSPQPPWPWVGCLAVVGRADGSDEPAAAVGRLSSPSVNCLGPAPRSRPVARFEQRRHPAGVAPHAGGFDNVDLRPSVSRRRLPATVPGTDSCLTSPSMMQARPRFRQGCARIVTLPQRCLAPIAGDRCGARLDEPAFVCPPGQLGA
jgi:hypothetical protein